MDATKRSRPVLLDARRSQLVLIDYQARLMPAIHRRAEIVRNAVRLGTLAHALGIPVIATEQSPEKLGPSVPEVRDVCATVIAKTFFDAYPDGLREPVQRLIAGDRSQVVVAGCEAHVCLLQTALGMLDDGLDVWIVVDACGSRSEHNREAALRRLHDAGAACVTTEMVGFEWVRHAGHPAFRTLQTLVR
ncbi:MAG TPA: hydrolase [Burkholderiaceae bacterium]|nr:hydrolase [Burkholderiaceae bacterium]